MAFVAVLLLVPVCLVVIGVLTMILGILALRSDDAATATAILRVTQGAGTTLLALIPLSVLWSQMQYGIVVLPVLGLILAIVWNLGMSAAARLARGV